MKAIFFSMALFFSIGMYAQSNTKFGLKAGLNVSNLGSSPNADYKSKASMNAGALAHIHLNKSWALQPEIMYSGQGAKLSGSTVNLHYVNVPIQLQYMFDQGFRIQTGPQIGFLAAANMEQNNTKTDIKDAFKTTDLGWTIGASYVATSGMGIDARYTHGITKINDGGSTNLYNQNFQVGLFYLFNHKY